MLKTTSLSLGLAVLFLSCSEEKTAVDLIVHHATIQTVDSAWHTYEAMCVSGGKIVALGSNREILRRYEAADQLDATGSFVFPGFIDAHCHFLGYGLGLQQADLSGTKSFDEVLSKTLAFSKREKRFPEEGSKPLGKQEQPWLIGRGWDQNDWGKTGYPDNTRLDSLFPDTPVLLERIDGHAALVNSKALELAHVNAETTVAGGELLKKGRKLTGILIDRAVGLVKAAIPQAGREKVYSALLNAQENCFSVGLTTVDDAGLMYTDVQAMDVLQKEGKLKIRIYAMLSDSAPNYQHYLDKGPYKTDRLNVRSFKFYADGALGSRGACLFKDYSDKPHWRGFLLNTMAHFSEKAELIDRRGFQMNTHCIGDSALNMVMDIYIRHCNKQQDRRWRIEHAQVVGPEDMKDFSDDIIPSVQPTHATSDMYWVQERLGKERMPYAYAYRRLLEAASTIALGTDFPVEDISPLKTFYAAVFRKDAKGYPPGGFQAENALSREQALRGMTIWAAYANFEEHEKGSLEPGKFADFVILDTDLLHCPESRVLQAKVLSTWVNGEQVFSAKN